MRNSNLVLVKNQAPTLQMSQAHQENRQRIIEKTATQLFAQFCYEEEDTISQVMHKQKLIEQAMNNQAVETQVADTAVADVFNRALLKSYAVNENRVNKLIKAI